MLCALLFLYDYSLDIFYQLLSFSYMSVAITLMSQSYLQ